MDENEAAPKPAVSDELNVIAWSAPEFIAHHKNAGWYAALALVTALAAALIYLLTKDKITTGVVVVGGLALGVYAGRQPRDLDYQLDSQGLMIGPKAYSFDDFRSFAVVPEGTVQSIVLMPLRRFAPLITLYYPAAEEDRIVEHIAARLPLADYNHDPIDRLMHRIRF